MKLAVNKTVVTSGGAASSRWVSGGDDGSDLEATLIGKYLGIEIQVKERNLIKHCEPKLIAIATKYTHTIMTGLDRALIAHKLWECYAIPAVLYCIEASPTSNSMQSTTK